ncbi:hypothetical protein FF1_027589 [Malus domestica]
MCSAVALLAQGKLAATSSVSMAEKKTETLGTSPESFLDLQHLLSLRSPLTSPTASITSTTAPASTPPLPITTSRAPASSSCAKICHFGMEKLYGVPKSGRWSLVILPA